jgi:hypothetical membrane protein
MLPAADRRTITALRLGVAIPFLYFGVQLVAAPCYPDYDAVAQVASELGSERSPCAAIFNGGVLLTGVVALVAALGLLRGLLRLGGNRVLAWATALALVSVGLATLMSGLYPLPHPRHGGGPVGAGMFVLPMLLAAATWRHAGSRAARVCLVLPIVLFFALFPILSGLAGVDIAAIRGLLQRLFALTVPADRSQRAPARAGDRRTRTGARQRADYAVSTIVINEERSGS